MTAARGPQGLQQHHVVWLLASSWNLASSRLQGLHIDRYLRGQGIRSSVVHAPRHFAADVPWNAEVRARLLEVAPGGVFVFQKLRGPHAVTLMQDLRARGGRVVFVDCDLDRRCRAALAADHVIVPSRKLADHYAALGVRALTVLEDGVDYFERFAREPVRPASPVPLRVLWIASATNWAAVEVVRRALATPALARCRLVTVSDHPEADYRWSNRRARRELARADIGVIPCAEGEEFAVKSANRLAMMMNAGLPVVVSPLPAYLELVEDGATGIVARDAAGWNAALRSLLDADTRRRIGAAARRHVRATLDPQRIGARWLEALATVAAGAPAAQATPAQLRRLARDCRSLVRIRDMRLYWREGRWVIAALWLPACVAGVARSRFLAGIAGRALAGRARAAFTSADAGPR